VIESEDKGDVEKGLRWIVVGAEEVAHKKFKSTFWK
jgi:hypothetical protein